MDHGKSDKELQKLNDTRDDHRNLNMGGLQYNELKLQLDTNHNVIYCDLPKCGSSVWQKQMMKVNFVIRFFILYLVNSILQIKKRTFLAPSWLERISWWWSSLSHNGRESFSVFVSPRGTTKTSKRRLQIHVC